MLFKFETVTIPALEVECVPPANLMLRNQVVKNQSQLVIVIYCVATRAAKLSESGPLGCAGLTKVA